MNFDLTPIFQGIIALLAALITYKLVPWIKSKVTEQQFDNLKTAARIAVYAAEQIYAHGDNDAKLEYVIAQLENAGFTLDFDTLRTAAEEAVYELKNDQMISKAFNKKYESEESDDEEANYHLPPLEDWPLEMIITFCKDNGIPCEGRTTKEDFVKYFQGMAAEADHPPDDQGGTNE